MHIPFQKTAMASEVLAANWLKQEVRAESTLPLLNFLLCTDPNQTAEIVAKSFHDIAASIGEKKPPIPDESEELREKFLRLMKNGPGKVTGDTTVNP